jgi:hypothetical protein
VSHLREVESPDIADPQNRINEQTIKALEVALAKARSGEILEVVVAASEPEGETWFIYTGTLSASKRVGMLEFVKAIFMRDWMAEERGG